MFFGVGLHFWLFNGLPKVADKGSEASDVDAVTRVINSKTPPDNYARRASFFKRIYETDKVFDTI